MMRARIIMEDSRQTIKVSIVGLIFLSMSITALIAPAYSARASALEFQMRRRMGWLMDWRSTRSSELSPMALS